jgi:hypothetical protein
VKWWLLAIPHYLVIGFFVGGWHLGWWDGGLVAVLTLIAAVTMAFTEKYPRDLFDLILGLNRWVLRVAAHASLMTDTYPPFRLDMGGTEPWLRGSRDDPRTCVAMTGVCPARDRPGRRLHLLGAVPRGWAMGARSCWRTDSARSPPSAYRARR